MLLVLWLLFISSHWWSASLLTALDDVQNQMAVLCMFFLFYYHCLTLFISCSPAACPPGTFKSTQGPGLCLQCPPNSRSTAEAATICVCRNGYYRGDADQPDEPCTSEYISHMTCTLLPTFHACILVGRAPVTSTSSIA